MLVFDPLANFSLASAHAIVVLLAALFKHDAQAGSHLPILLALQLDVLVVAEERSAQIFSEIAYLSQALVVGTIAFVAFAKRGWEEKLRPV